MFLASFNMHPNVTVSLRCFEDDRIIDMGGLSTIDWVYLGIDLALMLGICLGNGLIIATFFRIWKQLTLSNYLIFQLALADFALGCSHLYSALMTAFRKLVLNHNLCALGQAMFMFPGAASVFGILVITYNRYLAIVQNPLTYQDNPSSRYYVMYTLIIWIPSAILGFVLPMLWHNHCPIECSFSLIFTTESLKYMFIPFFVLLAFPVTTLYAHILVTARKHLRSITNAAEQPPGQSKKMVYMKGQIKILKAGFLIFTTFYILWLPFLVILGIQLYTDQLKQDSPMTTARFLTMCLIPLNSLGNPLIYAYRLPDIKAELTAMLLHWRKRLLCQNTA